MSPEIVLLDDDTFYSEALALYLRNYAAGDGVSLTRCETPRDALARVENDPGRARVLVMDCLTPGLDSDGFLRRVEATAPDCRVVLVSGRDVSDRDAPPYACVHALRCKTESRERILAAIRSALGSDADEPTGELSRDESSPEICGALEGRPEGIEAVGIAESSDAGEEDELSLRAVERRFIERALKATNNNKEQAARRLGISRASIYRKIKRYCIPA